MSDIVDRVRDRISASGRATDCGNTRLANPTTSERVRIAEGNLGFSLPPALVRLYTGLSNGRFGPGYGIAGVDGNGTDERRNDIVALHAGTQSQEFRARWPSWPASMLRLAYLGCGMHAAVDCSANTFSVWLFEPNPDESDLGFANNLIPYDMTFDAWIAAWADGSDVQLPQIMQEDGG